MKPPDSVIYDVLRSTSQAGACRPRVILADAHRIVGEGLARVLVDEFEFADIVSTADDLLDAVRRIEPDVVLSDIVLTAGSGLAVLKQLRDEGSRVPFVFVTMHAAPMIVSEAMRAGANGYVLKIAGACELRHALSEVLGGRCHVAPSVSARYLSFDHARAGLSEKQQEVLGLVAQGFSSGQIARLLSLSIRTVESHKYSMMQQLRVHSSVGLVRRAREVGFLVWN